MSTTNKRDVPKAHQRNENLVALMDTDRETLRIANTTRDNEWIAMDVAHTIEAQDK